jgi:CO dehydrogenase maturation factor
MCRAHATVRGFIGELVAQAGAEEQPAGGENRERDVVIDMEAGLEHLSRGTGRYVTRFLAVLEPYYRSMETARRVAELATELGVREVLAVANKVRDEADRKAIAEFCAAHGLRLIAEIPYDPLLLEAERAGAAPLDYRPPAQSPAMRAMASLARSLHQTA